MSIFQIEATSVYVVGTFPLTARLLFNTNESDHCQALLYYICYSFLVSTFSLAASKIWEQQLHPHTTQMNQSVLILGSCSVQYFM